MSGAVPSWCGDDWSSVKHVGSMEGQTGTWWTRSGTVVGHTVTSTWNSVLWNTRECVAAQWNVRKCESGLVTQAFFSPSVLSGVTSPFFNHLLNILILTAPRWWWSRWSPPDPIHQPHISHQTTPSVSLGRNQIHRRRLLLEKSSVPAVLRKFKPDAIFPQKERRWIRRHSWMMVKRVPCLINWAISDSPPPPHPAQEVTRPPSVEMENFARSKLTPRPPFGRARWEAVGVSGFCHRPWPLVAPGANDGVESSLSGHPWCCIPISTHCVCPV